MENWKLHVAIDLTMYHSIENRNSNIIVIWSYEISKKFPKLAIWQFNIYKNWKMGPLDLKHCTIFKSLSNDNILTEKTTSSQSKMHKEHFFKGTFTWWL